MGGSSISGDSFALSDLFSKATYAIDYYQREYAWTAGDVRTLVDDLCSQFDEAVQDPKTRRGMRYADPYFLGPIVYYEQRGGSRFLVDGQQRFTTVHLIFMHLHRQARELRLRDAEARLDRVIREAHGGTWRFRIDIQERRDLLQALYNGRKYEVPDHGASLSLRNLHARSLELEQLLAERIAADDLSRFTDWLLDRVILVGIQAPSRDTGFRIFESMNDRGARLTAVDLLKSFLLSHVGQDEEELNKSWREMLASLTPAWDDHGAPGRFLKSVLIAHHARLGGEFRDRDDINMALHLWIRQNADGLLGLKQPNQYFRFVEQLIKLATLYRTLQAASERPYPELEAVYFNAVNGLANQMTFILAAIKSDDPLTVAKAKARLVANFIDRWFVLRVLADEPALSRDLDDLTPLLIPQLRKCKTVDDVATCLWAEMPPDDGYESVRAFGLRGNNLAQVRYLLARLTAFAESQWGAPDLTTAYLSLDRGWDVEHIFANKHDRHPEISDPVEFRLLRNRLGLLGLLTKTVNRSLQDADLPAKVEVYRSENLLLRCLHRGFQQSQKPVRVLIQKYDLAHHMCALPREGGIRAAVAQRQELYRRLFCEIWKLESLGFPAAEPIVAEPADGPAGEATNGTLTTSTTMPGRAMRPTDLQRMVRAGKLRAGSALIGTAAGQEVRATIQDDGTIRLDATGDIFRKPDDPGQAVTGKRCSGMTFWHTASTDGTLRTLRQVRDTPVTA
ncbi:GmrSD restriction endonuclease domain-containing protein [Actinoplanes derwentensis]|uniref:DUF262 domain-containing protein n=1 Tax=Actinoplanes derwentensis TaxID=113562 RepID=A0A1H2D843_9ACTN|nr:DUF262 domain-containing protein [Actinoplanes derwentensis]GID90528.1 hypothetical protein Ade03nite_94520 [Actinoplanes derwentensis]SDT78928.1 Protein of unknown function [Actinoplanes derwentensis]